MTNDELRELEAKATPGPWRAKDDELLHPATKENGETVLVDASYSGYGGYVGLSSEDLAMIAALRNEATRLLGDSDALHAERRTSSEAILKLQKERDELRLELDRYYSVDGK